MRSSAPSVSRPDESTTGKHLPALDGVRGLAILAVLYCHLFWSNPDPSGPWIIRFFARTRPAGWIGVDLFFVLSGFLITGILYDTLPARHFFRNFYARRVLRIFPLYYGFFLLLLIITFFRGEHWSLRTLLLYLTYTDNLFLTPQPMLTHAWWVNVNHFWSLAMEEQFYLFWPLLIFLLRTRKRIAIAAAIGVLASLSIRIALVLSGYNVHHPFSVYSWTPAHLDGLFMGGLLAIAVRSRLHDRVLAWSVPVMLVCVALLALFWHLDPTFDIVEPWFITIGLTVLAIAFTCLVAAALKPNGALQRFASARVLRFFGRYSYGLYVYHYTIAGVVLDRLRPIVDRFGSKALGVIVPGLVAGFISLAIAWCSYTFFESRFLLLKRRFHDNSPRPKLHEVAQETQAAALH